MTAVQMGLTIAVCTAATMLTRFLPFLIFSSKEQQRRRWCGIWDGCCPQPFLEC